MLTPDELIEARKRAEKWLSMPGGGKDAGTYVLILLDHIDQVTKHNEAMRTALEHLAAHENWDFHKPLWLPEVDPRELAKQALHNDG